MDQNDTDQNDMEDNEGDDDDSDVADDDEDDQVDTDVDSQDEQDVTEAGGEGTDSNAGQASKNEDDDDDYTQWPSRSEESDVTLAVALVIAFFSCLLLAILATVAKHTCMKQPVKKMEMVDDGEPAGSARPLTAD